MTVDRLAKNLYNKRYLENALSSPSKRLKLTGPMDECVFKDIGRKTIDSASVAIVTKPTFPIVASRLLEKGDDGNKYTRLELRTIANLMGVKRNGANETEGQWRARVVEYINRIWDGRIKDSVELNMPRKKSN